jgi:putative ABC transport system ATP-binding protein
MSSPNGPPALVLTGVEHACRRTVALRGVYLSVATSEVVAVTGPSGCGKSTLLHAAAGGIIRPQGGTVLLDGQDLALLDVAERAGRAGGRSASCSSSVSCCHR